MLFDGKSTTMSFWRTKKLSEMSIREWESLCDGCGKCCLNKLEDEETGKLFWTSVACDLIDLTSCRCSRYTERTRLVPECLLTDGNDLPDWHPLVSGNADSVKDAGVSISSYALKESDVEDLEDHIIEWL